MFAKLANLHISKRTVIIVATVVVLAISMFAVAPGISYAGPATSPSGCGICNG